jgi:hypothetical protein
MLAYHDAATGQHRFACFDGDRLAGALFLGSEPVAVSRAWTCEQLTQQHPSQRARMAVIAGRPGTGCVDRGATICSCFGVGVNEIVSAISGGCIAWIKLARRFTPGRIAARAAPRSKESSMSAAFKQPSEWELMMNSCCCKSAALLSSRSLSLSSFAAPRPNLPTLAAIAAPILSSALASSRRRRCERRWRSRCGN